MAGCSVAPASDSLPVATGHLQPTMSASASTLEPKMSSQSTTPSPVQTPSAPVATEYTIPGGAAEEYPALPMIPAGEIVSFTLTRAGAPVFPPIKVGVRCTVVDCIPDTGVAQLLAGESPQVPSDRSIYMIGHSNRYAPTDSRWPFSRLQEARFGDVITLETTTGTFVYTVGNIQHIPYSDYPNTSMQTLLPYRLMALACEVSKDGKGYVGVFAVDANLTSAMPKV